MHTGNQQDLFLTTSIRETNEIKLAEGIFMAAIVFCQQLCPLRHIFIKRVIKNMKIVHDFLLIDLSNIDNSNI